MDRVASCKAAVTKRDEMSSDRRGRRGRVLERPDDAATLCLAHGGAALRLGVGHIWRRQRADRLDARCSRRRCEGLALEALRRLLDVGEP